MTAPATPTPQGHDLITERLARIRETIDAADKAREDRMAAWLEARQLDPPVTYARLAAVSGVAEPYVIREVGKRRSAAAAQAQELAARPAKRKRRMAARARTTDV